MARNKLLICLAVSPIPFAVCVVAFGWEFENLLGSMVGDLAIVLPLLFLIFARGTPKPMRRGLIVATAMFLLLVPAVASYFAPAYATRIGAFSAPIRLDPHPDPTGNAAFLSGLSVKHDVLILRSRTEEDSDDSSPYSAFQDQEWHHPPSHFSDESGNGLEFTLIAPDLLRFKDDRGGYADVKWNGSQFQLADSHSAGQADGAKSPDDLALQLHLTLQLQKIGDLLLILAPLLAWLALTRWAWMHDRPARTSSAILEVSGVLQVLGIIGFTVTILGSSTRPDEVSGGILVLGVLWSAAASLAGLVILGWKLAEIRRTLS